MCSGKHAINSPYRAAICALDAVRGIRSLHEGVNTSAPWLCIPRAMQGHCSDCSHCLRSCAYHIDRTMCRQHHTSRSRRDSKCRIPALTKKSGTTSRSTSAKTPLNRAWCTELPSRCSVVVMFTNMATAFKNESPALTEADNAPTPRTKCW